MPPFLPKTPRWIKPLLFAWVRLENKPQLPSDWQQLCPDTEYDLIYVIENKALADRLVVQQLCEDTGMATQLQQFGELGSRLPVLSLQKPAELQRSLAELLRLQQQHPERQLLLVPISVHWGRRPKKDPGSLVRAALTEAWQRMGKVRKLFTIAFNGRHTYAEISAPINLAQLELAPYQQQPELAVRKLHRVLRVHFRLVRTRLIGPELSHRRLLIQQLLGSKAVQHSIDAQAQAKQQPRLRVEKQAQRYFEEIAANMSYPTVRMMDVLLSWLWNRIYSGIKVHNIEPIRQLSQDSTLIYVPCHRSHIDYLLMSYSLYYNGLNLPHIAAGVNLNMPVVGSVLRRSGAFFLRRSFKGDKLYAAVFNEYLRAMFAKGFAIEYYVEGGRSRTGRMLDPKTGLLSMTLRSFLNYDSRPLKFVPVYIGYERIFEEKTYLNELRGQRKQQESLGGLLASIKRLKNYGQAHINFGEPLDLAEFLDLQQPEWRQDLRPGEQRLDWFAPAVDQLAITIVERINQAAIVTPINLIASVLLATPKQAITAFELEQQLALMRDLQQQLVFSDKVAQIEGEPAQWIAYALSLGALKAEPQGLGPIYYLSQEQAIRLSYYRNNNLHLFAIASLVACLLCQGKALSQAQLTRRLKASYPFVRNELFLPWNDAQLEQQVPKILQFFTQQGLIEHHEHLYVATSEANFGNRSLWLLAQLMMPTLERYYLTLAILVHSGSDQLTAGDLEHLSQLVAERLSLLSGLNAPEFFDRNLFKKFIQVLRKQQLLDTNDAGRLIYDQRVDEMMATANDVLRRTVRQTILQVAHLSRDELRQQHLAGSEPLTSA